MSYGNEDNNRSSFKEALVIIFMIIVAFGLTVYGIIFLSNSFMKGDENLARDGIAEQSAFGDGDSSGGDVFGSSDDDEFVYDFSDYADKDPVAPSNNPPAPEPTQPAPEETQTPPVQAPLVDSVAADDIPEFLSEGEEPAYGQFALQYMALTNQEAAMGEMRKLRQNFSISDAYVVMANLPHGTFYRIRLGIGDNREEIEALKRHYADVYSMETILVRVY